MTEQPLEFTNYSFHHDVCEVCIKAARLRFASATTEEINRRRCPEGKVLFDLYLKSLKEN